MPDYPNITDSQDEQTLDQLFRDADQIQVPIFQREYVWTKREFDQLIEDINLIRSGQEKSQFLGAIVSYENKRERISAGRLRALSIVDGQQRILTLYIFIIALVECYARVDKREIAHDIVRQFLLIQPRRGLEVNTRIFPASADVSQFRVILDKINTPEVLQDYLIDEPINPPPPSGESSGRLLTQYNRILRFLQDELENEEIEKIQFLEEMLEIIVGKLSFVHLLLNDASGANKIFERLNFRGRRVGTIDLVRNEIFSGLIDKPIEAKRIFDSIWGPFVNKFEGNSDPFFFPYCLVQNSNTTKSDLFTHLRTFWNSWDSEKIVNHMSRYQKPFMSIHSTGIFPGDNEVSSRLGRLVRMNRPSSIYPFVMSMLDDLSEGKISSNQCVTLLDVLESFLVRRAVIGFEPTGLHALFKGLWQQLDDFSAEEFIKKISERPTIQWPNNQEFKEAIKTRPLAKTRICNYLLVEFDLGLQGDHPSSTPTIEHILPNTYITDNEWAKLFSKEEHRNIKDTWANLVPLSAPLNSSLQTSPYNIKKERYTAESMFITPRYIADKYTEWNLDTIEQRVKELIEWAVERWPYHN